LKKSRQQTKIQSENSRYKVSQSNISCRIKPRIQSSNTSLLFMQLVNYFRALSDTGLGTGNEVEDKGRNVTVLDVEAKRVKTTSEVLYIMMSYRP